MIKYPGPQPQHASRAKLLQICRYRQTSSPRLEYRLRRVGTTGIGSLRFRCYSLAPPLPFVPLSSLLLSLLYCKGKPSGLFIHRTTDRTIRFPILLESAQLKQAAQKGSAVITNHEVGVRSPFMPPHLRLTRVHYLIEFACLPLTQVRQTWPIYFFLRGATSIRMPTPTPTGCTDRQDRTPRCPTGVIQ
jgi:hypothetical protein